MNRRRLLTTLGWGSAAVAGLAATGAGAAAVLWVSADLDNTGRLRFDRPLPVPPLAEPDRTDGRLTYTLTAAPGHAEFLPGVRTPTWGFNGGYLGPTIRARRGDHLQIQVRNQLPERTAVHWHGAHLPARADGGPHSPIDPGQTWTATWQVDQPPATLWYHPHPHQTSSRHAYRGLAGLLLIDDAEDPDGARLPSRYGIDDIPVILQDKRLTPNGQLEENPGFGRQVGRLGDTVAINGVVGPYLAVTSELTRLRILNASDARIYHLGLDDNSPFSIVGSDGGLLASPHTATRVVLSPGERVEIVIHTRPTSRRTLRSYPLSLNTNVWDARFAGGDDTIDLLELRAAGALTPSDALSEHFGDVDTVPLTNIATTRTFELLGYSINGQAMDLRRIDFGATVDTTEIWNLSNADDVPHNFHVHQGHFTVLEVDNAPPPPPLCGRKDTIYLPAHSAASIAVRFTRYTDPSFPFMFHCHLLSHEDFGMMGQFVVLAPGQTPGNPPVDPGHSHTEPHR